MRTSAIRLVSVTLCVTVSAGCSGSSPELGFGGMGGTQNSGASAHQTSHPVAAGSSSVGASLASGGKSSLGGNRAMGGATAAVPGATSGGSTPTAVDCRKEGDGRTTLVFVNHCQQALTFRGSDIAGDVLAPGAFACVDVGSATESISSKRYWGYTDADPGAERHTLAEFTFNSDFYDLDWYDISHVDAHNLPMAILPSARPQCRQLSCPQDFLSTCPSAGQYRDASGELVACVSPNRDDPSNPVVLLFEQCDDAYAWSGDDQQGSDMSPMIGCEVEDFDIVFCPEAP